MEPLIWSLVLFVHILAATFWVRGQLMLAVVVMPLLRRSTPELVREMAGLAGQRFATLTNFGPLPALVPVRPHVAAMLRALAAYEVWLPPR